ncbi:MAG: hypothetical protein OEY14_17040 [Myxococcales bacterium]|nr:hypothetical protein [Myxococcales bacterium]
MSHPAVVVGLGQMGGVFAHGLLRVGVPVYPINRGDSLRGAASVLSEPRLVLIAVGEAQLEGVLSELPATWRPVAGLLQNELLPGDWRRHGLHQPTVAVVWFEKKAGRPLRPILPTPIAGPSASLLVDALTALDIPAKRIEREALLGELVLKNLYILTSNIAGLAHARRGADAGISVGTLLEREPALVREVAREAFAIQEARLGASAPEFTSLWEGLVAAFGADPEHQAMGRSAPARLMRALEIADAHGLAASRLREIEADR